MKIDRLSKKHFGVACKGGNQKGHIKAVCLHSTESGPGTADAVAGFLHNRSDGSVHIVVDDREAYVLANDSTIVCGAAGYNTGVIHIEQVGYARWSRKAWFRRERELARAAFWVAVKLRKHGLKPRRMLGKAEHERGGGYTYHDEVSKWYLTDHTDPGKGYPRGRMDVWIKFFYHHPRARKVRS